MPRASAASLILLQGQRLEPPPHLSKAERAAFVEVVDRVKPEHFVAEDAPIAPPPCKSAQLRRRWPTPLWKRPIASGLRTAARRATSSSWRGP